MNRIQIAIDGPAGSGKGSVAKIVSKHFGLKYLDTGAMYRALTYYIIKNGLSFDMDDEAIDNVFKKIHFGFVDENIFLNGENVTSEIRKPVIDENVYKVASDSYIREKMVDLQRNIAAENDVIMEGRDICSVVLKDASFKFYLDASPEIRAKRRYLQDLEKGLDVTFDQVYDDIIRRDKVDIERTASPLVYTEDSIYIDSSNLSLDDVVNKIESIVKKGI